MKKYHYHPDNIVIVTNGDKVYADHISFAKFDFQRDVVRPLENSTEFHYIVGYGTRNFNKGDMISFSESARPDLDELIDSIDQVIQRKNRRQVFDGKEWEIPEDMK